MLVAGPLSCLKQTATVSRFAGNGCESTGQGSSCGDCGGFQKAKIAAGKLDVKPIGTHQFKLNQMMEAYDVFSAAAKNNALKMIISR